MNDKIIQFINESSHKGFSETCIKNMLIELYLSDLINFDCDGNPYWVSCGYRLT